jgi:gamma-glutamyltranspeptidase/glutathione hydrolase
MSPIGPDRAQNWTLSKSSAISRGGAVASQNAIAAEAGARVLRNGGNAIDAAIATSFAVSVVEPWMSGLGGGGYMLVYLAKEKRVRVFDFGMIAPRQLDPADYPPVEGDGAGDLFQWPAVLEDRNVYGYHSIAVPTQVAGIALAHERYASKPWADLIAPAVELAEGGLPVNWFTTLRIAGAAQDLRRFETSSAVYLDDGLAPTAMQGKPPPRRDMGALSDTLRRLAQAGPRDFYEGEIAGKLVADAQAGGSRLSADDLASYRASECDPLEMDYQGAKVYAAPGLTAGPTLFDTLSRIDGRIEAQNGSPTAESFGHYAAALKAAFETRLATMGDADDARDPACTTHLTAIDGEGNMVTLTQTLLSAFGSKVVFPKTGILMNNGIMWFDTRPGNPNSLAGGKRPLCNMCPAIVRREDGFSFALGASGGRRIMPAVMQNISFMVDCGLGLSEAIHHPRIDVSGGDTANINIELPEDVARAVGNVLPVIPVEDAVFPSNFACPNGVADDPQSGQKSAQSYPMFPLSGAAGA